MTEIESKLLSNYDNEINHCLDKMVRKNKRLKFIVIVLLLTLFSLICLILYHFYSYHY